MSWGVEPTEPARVVPVSRRTGGRVRIEWRGVGYEQEALIEQHDGRLWTCLTGEFVTDEAEYRCYRYCGRLTTAGCEPLRLVGRTLLDVRQSVERFANMAGSSYVMLVADAEGTTTHPCSGAIVQVTIRREVRRQRGFLPTDYQVEVQEEMRVGRINGPQITLFPSLAEVMSVLGDLETSGALFIPPAARGLESAAMVTTQREVVASRRTELSAAAIAVEAAIPPERSNRSIRL